jgi:hypothetical protein
MVFRVFGTIRDVCGWYGVPRLTRVREWSERDPKPNAGGPACSLTRQTLARECVE